MATTVAPAGVKRSGDRRADAAGRPGNERPPAFEGHSHRGSIPLSTGLSAGSTRGRPLKTRGLAKGSPLRQLADAPVSPEVPGARPLSGARQGAAACDCSGAPDGGYWAGDVAGTR